MERARIVLARLDGKRNDEVNRSLGVRQNTVGLGSKRFAADGVAGLQNRPRPGKTATYDPRLRLQILRRLEQAPPKGLSG